MMFPGHMFHRLYILSLPFTSNIKSPSIITHSNSCSPGKSIAASAVLLGLVLVGRAVFIFPLSCVSNCVRNSSSDKFDLKQQVLFGVSSCSLASELLSIAENYNNFNQTGNNLVGWTDARCSVYGISL